MSATQAKFIEVAEGFVNESIQGKIMKFLESLKPKTKVSEIDLKMVQEFLKAHSHEKNIKTKTKTSEKKENVKEEIKSKILKFVLKYINGDESIWGDDDVPDTKLILSTNDVGDICDGWLEKYERKNGEVISEDDFEILLNTINDKFLKEKKIYKNGDWNSFNEIVRSKGLISWTEYKMKQSIKESKGRVNFRDTEFPVDKDGMYTEK